MGGFSEKLAWVLLGFFLGMNISVAIVLGVLAALYALVFVFFCGAARPLVRSLVDVPLVSLRLQGCVAWSVLAYVGRGFKPRFPNWSLTFEVAARLMRFMFDQYGDVIAHENAAMMRAPFAMHGKMILKSNCKLHGTRAEKLEAHGLDHWWLRDVDAAAGKPRLVVIHYHGGGFAMSDPLQDVELANQTHSLLKQALRETHGIDVAVDVLLSNYRKAPEHPYPAPFDDCFATYEHVLAHEQLPPNRILLSGDSAGGWMSLAICKRLRDAGRDADLPLAALLYSPLADFDEKGGDEKTPHCVLAAQFVDAVHNAYLAKLTDPAARREASPVNWDLTRLPPMFVQYGTEERFYEQGLRLKAIADKQGVTNWELDVLEGMPHDAAMFPTDVLPFAKEAIRHAAVFAAKRAAPVLVGEPEPEAK